MHIQSHQRRRRKIIKVWKIESRECRREVGDCLAEAAEASARDAEGRASNTMTVSDNTAAGMAASPVFSPQKTHDCLLFVGG